MSQYFKKNIENTERHLEETEKKKGLIDIDAQRAENQMQLLENQISIMNFLQRNFPK